MAADESDILQPLLRRNVAMLMAWRGLRHARAARGLTSGVAAMSPIRATAHG